MNQIELFPTVMGVAPIIPELSADDKKKGKDLINASCNKSWEIIYNILAENPNSQLYDYINEYGDTPVNYAIVNNMVNLSLDLISRMKYQFTINQNSSTVLTLTCKLGSIADRKKIISAIIQSGKYDFKLVTTRNNHTNTALTYICRLGADFEDEALQIITSSQNYAVNFADERGHTALLIAAEKKMTRVVEKLMANPECHLTCVDQAGHGLEYYLKTNQHYEMLVKLKHKNYSLAQNISKSIPWMNRDQFYEWYASVSHKDLMTQLNQIRKSMNDILHSNGGVIESECPSPSRNSDR